MPVLVDGELVLYGFCGDDYFDDGFTDRDVLAALAEIGRETDVTVRLNSGGGFTDAGKAIFNALKAHLGRVTVSIDAIAASSASIIAMAGDEIIMRSGALMMVHEANGVTMGNAEEHRKSAEWLERESVALASIYAEKSGRPLDEVRAIMLAETWMTAEEAVEAGFADRADGVEAKAVAAFDYRAYAHAPSPLKAAARDENWALPWARRAAAAASPRQMEDAMTDKTKAGESAAIDPKPKDGDQPHASPPDADAVAAAMAEGRAAERAYVREIEDICDLAGAPHRARAFIDAETKPAEVRKALLDERATADAGRRISTQHTGHAGDTAPKPGALAARMAKMVGKEG